MKLTRDQARNLSGGGSSFFKLEEGKSAMVRFLYNTMEDMEPVICHSVQLPDSQYPQNILCARETEESPLSDCIYCAKGEKLPLFINHLWVVEGPFNLWSLYEYHKSGVALLGTGTQYQYKQLLTVKCNDYVLALDGDNAGHLGTKKLGSFLFNNRKKVYVACVPNNHDINDMSYEQFKQMEVIPYENWVQLYKNN